MTLRAGARLGPHEILGPIGAGGMGEVYRARDCRLGREVAIKVLPATSSGDPHRLRRLEQEARAAGALNHPNIVAIFDVGIHEGAPYVVSELLQGETLRERLDGGPIPLRKALDYAAQIAQGLAAAHEKGITHRDLKPSNLFLTEDGRIKILDFGLARVAPVATGGAAVSPENATVSMDAQTEPGAVLGTVGYMSPEQVRGEVADHRSDIFSFGAILYEMLSGRRAFSGDSAVETMNAILREDPPEIALPQGTLPPAVDRVVRRCLEKRVGERFQSARDVAFALEALSAVSGGTTWPALAPLPRRRRLSRALGLVAVAAAISALAFLAGRRLAREEPPRFKQVTFRRGFVASARFAPDGETVVYSARWEGRGFEVFAARPGHPESRPLGLPEGFVASISSSGEMALVLRRGGPPILARAPLAGGEPRELLEGVDEADWAPDGATLAVTRSVAGVQRLELPIGRVLYETPSGLLSPSVSPRGDRVAVLETHEALGTETVVVVDRDGRKLTPSSGWRGVRDTFTSARFQGLRWSPSGDEVWFTAREPGGASALHAVTLSGGHRVIARLPGAMVLRDVAKDGRILLSRDDVRAETRGRGPGEAEERDLSWLDGSWVLDLSPDGRTLLFSEQGEGGGPRRAIYLRRTDGSPAVKLGEGTGSALSPDGKWALSLDPSAPGVLVLLPTGPGEPKRVKVEGISDCVVATWLPDGNRLLLVATEPGRTWRLYVLDLAGGRPRPIAPEGTRFLFSSSPVSPDGTVVFAESADGMFWLYPVEGGEARPVPGLDPAAREVPVRWSADGRSIYVWRSGFPPKVYRLDLRTRRRELWREIRPPDLTGVSWLPWVMPTPDGSSYVYSYRRTLSELYVVEGLR